MHIAIASEKLTHIVDVDAIDLLLDIEHTCKFRLIHHSIIYPQIDGIVQEVGFN